MSITPEPPQITRLLVTIGVALVFLVGWHLFYEAPRIEAARDAVQQRQQQEAAQQHAPTSDADTLALDRESAAETSGTVAPAPVQPLRPRHEILSDPAQQATRVQILTDRLHGSINLRGARLDDLTLAHYHRTPNPSSQEVVLLSPATSYGGYFAEFGWLSPQSDLTLPNAHTLWQADKETLRAGETLTLTWDNGNGLDFLLKIQLDQNYMFRVETQVSNRTGQSLALQPYGLVHRTPDTQHIGTDSTTKENNYIVHEGMVGVFHQTLEEIGYEDLAEMQDGFIQPQTQGWLGITDKYWLTALVPTSDTSFTGRFLYANTDQRPHYQADFLQPQQILTPDATLSSASYFFAGAKEVALLDEYEEQLAIPLFDHAVDFGILYFLTKPIFLLLLYFNQLVENFGIAILLLTVVVKAVLFPISVKSYSNMYHMKRLQPQLRAAADRHKGDPMARNKEVAAIYKREKVNPATGCLGILIQLPVAFALYKVLSVSIEMRHAPFFGWIQDLSAADPTSVLTFFGLVPLPLPLFLEIGAWPVIMALTMVIQQRLAPTPADPTQATVMRFLPLVLLFLLARFPAGLVIYWSWSNLLSILQQQAINRMLAHAPTSRRKT